VDPGEARRHSADPDGGGGERFGPSGAEASAPVRYYLEPIRKLLESDESDVIPYEALDSLESARCGPMNTAWPRIEAAFVTQAI